MTREEWIAAGRPHWQCEGCKGILVTVPIADDFVCALCKNPRLRNLVATEEDFQEWLAGRRYNDGRYLLDYCVCLKYPKSCRFHTDKVVTDGPHNILPGLDEKFPGWATRQRAWRKLVLDSQQCPTGREDGVWYQYLSHLGTYAFHDEESSRAAILKMDELTKARLYKALYDDGMRIDRVPRIIKEAK